MQDEVNTKPAEIPEVATTTRKGARRQNFLMWCLWTVYIGLAVAVAIVRGDGPQGQGLASVRVESLLSKMTIEDKVNSCFACRHFVTSFSAITCGVLLLYCVLYANDYYHHILVRRTCALHRIPPLLSMATAGVLYCRLWS